MAILAMLDEGGGEVGSNTNYDKIVVFLMLLFSMVPIQYTEYTAAGITKDRRPRCMLFTIPSIKTSTDRVEV